MKPNVIFSFRNLDNRQLPALTFDVILGRLVKGGRFIAKKQKTGFAEGMVPR
jgi:hypothetical protein